MNIGSRIIIVDDDPAMLQAMSAMVEIRMNEVAIDTCESAEAALERITTIDYDAIISDVKMPGMDGFQLMARVLAIRPTTPTLLVTGHGDHDMGVQALKAGAYAFIPKPIDRDYFIAWLKRAVQLRQLTRTVEAQNQMLERTVQERTAELERTNADLKAALEQERRSDERLTHVLQSTTDGVQIIDRQWRFTYLNAAAGRMLREQGRDPEALIGRQIFDEAFPDSKETPLHCNFQRVMTDRIPLEFENFYKPWNRWYHLRAYPVPDNGIAVFFSDITERKQHDAAVQERNRRLDLLARTSQELVFGGKPEPAMLQTVFDEVCELLGTELFFAYLVGDDPRMLRLVSSGGLTPEQKDAFAVIRFGEYLCGTVADRRERLIVENLPESGYVEASSLCAAGVTCYGGFPLLAHGRLLGTVAFATRTRPRFREGELQMVQTVCDQVAATLDRARLFNELRAGEERFRTLVVRSSQCVWRFKPGVPTPDDDPAAVWWEDLTGQSREAAQDWGWLEKLHPDDRERARAAWTHALGHAESGVEYRMEYRVRTREGSYRRLLARGVPVLAENGTLREWAGTINDITELKEAEEHVRASEARFRALVSQATAGIAQVDFTGRFTFANPRYCEIVGYTEAELLRMRMQDLTHPDDLPRNLEQFKTLATGGSGFIIEKRYVRKDGTLVWVNNSVTAIRGEDGRLESVVAVTLDITERKRAEEALRENEQRFEIASRATNDAIWDWNLLTDAVWWNDGVRTLFGYASAQVKPDAAWWVEHIHPDDRERVVAGIHAIIDGNQTFWRDEYRFLRTDGSYAAIFDRGYVIRDGAGTSVRMLGAMQDVTERKRAEQLEADQKRILELMTRDAPLSEVFESVIRMVEKQSGSGMLASILLLDEDGLHLRHGAAPSLPEAYNRAIDGIAIGPKVGSCGTAAYRKQAVYASDIAGDALWADYAALALSHNLRACWSTPILSNAGRLLGTFAMYYPDVREPNEHDLRLVEVATRTAGIAIERKRTENALRESEERFRNMADNSPVMLWVTDPAGRCTHLNQRWYQFTGQTPETGLGFGWLDAVHPDDREASGQTFLSANERHAPFHLEYRLRRHDGEYRWAIDAAAPRISLGGEFLGYIGSVIDITERKEAEETLRRHRERFDLVADASQVGFWFCDLPFDKLSWDSRVKEHFWLAPDADVTIETFFERLHPDDRMRTTQAIAESIASHTQYDVEYRTVSPDGEQKWIRAIGRTFYDDAGEPKRFDGVTLDITQRKRNEEASARLAAIVASSSDPILSKTLEGIITTWNAGAERMFGYTAEEMVGQSITRLIPPDRREEEDHILARLRVGEHIEHYETVRVTKDGRNLDVSLTISPIKDSTGTIIGASKIIVDITQRKRDEDALRKSEERFRALVTTSSDVVYRMSPDWSEMRQLHGRDFIADTEEPSRTWLQEYIHPDDQSHVMAVIDEAIRTRSIFELEHRVWRVDGTLGWTFSRAIPLLDAKGDIVEWFGAASDVTARKRAEEALRESAERLRFMAESMPQKIFTATPTGDVDYFNRQWMEFTGLTFEQIRDWGWLQFIHPDDVEENIRRWKQSIETGDPFHLEHRFRRKDGVYRWHLSRAHAMRDADGTVRMWIGSNTDIEDQKQTEEDIRRLLQEAERRAQELREKQEQLIQAAKLASLGEMATGVAHEINNPLNNIALVVGNLLERLKRGCLDPDTLPRQLQSTMSQVEKAAIIVDHLRTFARPATMPHESISINEVVRSAVSLTQTQFRHADIDLTVDLTNSNPAVLGNAIHLEQVLINLLTNARDAVQGAPKKAVHIGSALEGSDVTVTVADTGSGIPKDLQARIFDPFFTTKDVGKGTGLGLSISYGIIQDHGGEITVESIPANGAKFTVRLPLAPDPSQPGHA